MTLLPLSTNDPQAALPRTNAVIENGMQVGLHVGAQIYAAVGNQVRADFGWGLARPGVPMTADTVMLWLSSGKPVGAVALLQLVERGLLDLQHPVARYLPEFAQNGKETITFWHLLTHTAGFRFVDINWPESSWDEIIARICKCKPERDWLPGQKAGYHPYTSWYILGEAVRRIDGRSYSDYVRQQIFEPLGMRDSWIGVPAAQYEAYGNRFGIMLHVDKAEPYTHRYDSLEGASVCVPGGNGHGPMHDLGRFYHMLAGGGTLDGVRILSEQNARLMTTPRRVGMYDQTFKHVMEWGLGTIIDSNRYGAETVPYGYGVHSSSHTFGHGGAQSSIGFCDPDHQLVAAVVFNGMPSERKHDLRMRALLAALYEDLGLA